MGHLYPVEKVVDAKDDRCNPPAPSRLRGYPAIGGIFLKLCF
jgi:hypothetical protein